MAIHALHITFSPGKVGWAPMQPAAVDQTMDMFTIMTGWLKEVQNAKFARHLHMTGTRY